MKKESTGPNPVTQIASKIDGCVIAGKQEMQCWMLPMILSSNNYYIYFESIYGEAYWQNWFHGKCQFQWPGLSSLQGVQNQLSTTRLKEHLLLLFFFFPKKKNSLFSSCMMSELALWDLFISTTHRRGLAISTWYASIRANVPSLDHLVPAYHGRGRRSLTFHINKKKGKYEETRVGENSF